MMTMFGFLALTGVGVLTAAALITLLMRGSSASLRHLIWTAALATLVAAPLLEVSGFEVEVPVPAMFAELFSLETAPAVPTRLVSAPPTVSLPPEAMTLAPSAEKPAALPSVKLDVRSSSAKPDVRGVPVADPSGTRTEPVLADSDGTPRTPVADMLPVSADMSPVSSDVDWLGAGLGLWAFGAVLLLAVTLFGHVRARWLTVRDVERAPASTRRHLAALCVRLGMRRPVRLVVSRRLRVPATWGLLESTIILPAEHSEWSKEMLDRVLLHELAHIRRRDCATYLIAELARALHWPNPLVWLAVYRQRLESERACDDHVLGNGDSASAYAEDLVVLVRSLRGETRLPRAALAMAEPGGIAGRVRAILDPTRSRLGVGRTTLLTLASLTVALVGAMTVLTPVAMSQERPSLPLPPPPAVEPLEVVAPDLIPEPAEVVTPDLLPEPMEFAVEPVPALPALEEPAIPSAISPPPAPTRTAFLERLSGDLGRFVQGLQQRMTNPGAVQERLCVFQGDGRRSTSMNTDDDWIRIRWETDRCRVDIDIEGRVTFANDDTDIADMARGALFELEERIGSSRRRVRLEGASGGEIERRYWVDGDEVGWGPEAERWMAEILPELFRHTTINAEARVRRMLAEGGPDRVFEEVGQIHSDHVTRRYLTILMDEADLTESEYGRVIDLASDIESDHSVGVLLMAVIERAGLRPAFQDPLLEAAEGIDSDHQKTMVLRALLESPLSSAQLDDVVRSAATIESDHNLGVLLSTVASEGRLSDAGRAVFMETLRTIDSDHTHGVVLDAFLDAGRLSDDELTRVLEMTDGIDSDHTLGTLLQRIAREYDLSDRQTTAYLRSASEIDSDHQLAMTANALIERVEFGPAQMDLVIVLAGRVDSDHQKGMILHALIGSRTLAPDEIESILDLVAQMDSDHQVAVVLELLIEDEELDGDGVRSVLEATRLMDSDHQRSTVMVELARRFEIEGATRERYIELADDLSRHNRDQVLVAIVRR